LVQRTVNNSISGTTAHARDLLLRRFQAFCQLHSLQPTLDNSMMFLMSVAKKSSSRLIYLNHLKQKLEPPSQVALFRRGLRRQKAQEPLQQAVPLLRQQVLDLYLLLDRHLRIPLYLARRTASRMDEVESLTGSMVLEATNEGVVIWWGANLKTSSDDQFKCTTFVHVTPPTLPEPPHLWTEFVHAMDALRRRPSGHLLADARPLIQAIKQVNPQLSGHSVKAGAVTDLMNLAAQGLLPASSIPLVAKHQQLNPPLPTSTITYARDKIALTKALGTGAITKFL
jgi:hypothetical protein